MMAKVLLLVLLGWGGISIAQPPDDPNAGLNQPPKVSTDNVNKSVDPLGKPVATVDNAQKPLAAESQPPPSPARATLNEGGAISDPTEMMGSFNQALKRINPKTGAAVGIGPTLPDIHLAASAISSGNNKSALLNINGKNRLLKEGGKLSFVEKNQLYEIQVTKIEKDHVDIMVMPMGKLMTLE